MLDLNTLNVLLGWEDVVTNAEVLRRSDMTGMEALLILFIYNFCT